MPAWFPRGPVPESCELIIHSKIARFVRYFKDARPERVKKCGKTASAVRLPPSGVQLVFFLKIAEFAVDISGFV